MLATTTLTTLRHELGTAYALRYRRGMTETEANRGKHRLTRMQVADRLGISTSSVRRLEWDLLHPEVDDRGVHLFDPTEVDAVKEPRRRAAPRPHDADARERSRRGRLAAKVFRMFARYLTLQQIVVTTREPPEVIRELYREWSVTLEEAEWARRDVPG
jgi:hypothetical protein